MRRVSFASLSSTRRITLSDSTKAGYLTDSLVTQFEPVNDPSIPTVDEMAKKAMRTNEYTRRS
jgi:hypothetical protein